MTGREEASFQGVLQNYAEPFRETIMFIHLSDTLSILIMNQGMDDIIKGLKGKPCDSWHL